MRNPDHPGGDWPGAWGSLPEAPTLAIGSLCEKRSRWLLSGTVVKMMITTVRGVKRNQTKASSARPVDEDAVDERVAGFV